MNIAKLKEMVAINDEAQRDQFKHDEEGYDDGIVHATYTEQELMDYIKEHLSDIIARLERAEKMEKAVNKVVEAWDFDEIGQVDGALIDALRSDSPKEK